MSTHEERIREAEFLRLNTKVKSTEAQTFIERLSKAVAIVPGDPRTRVYEKFRRAIAALVSDLLDIASSDRDAFGYRSLDSRGFTGEPVRYDTFNRAQRCLAHHGYIKVLRSAEICTTGELAARFQAKAELIDAAEASGIPLGALSAHFEMLPRPKKTKEPLLLRRGRPENYWRKEAGGAIRVDLTREPAKSLAKQVDDLNAFFSDVLISPERAHWAFYRVFNQASIFHYNWNKGGRLISAGNSYQQMPQKNRADITLNGEEVVELDIRASHLTILHGLLGKGFDPAAKDPYDVAGLPRHVVKGSR